MKSERGSASLEFIAAGVLLIVPLIYLVLVLGRVQAGALAAESIARQAVRVYVTAPSVAQATTRVGFAVTDGLTDFHFAPADGATKLSCAPASSPCLKSDATVTVTQSITVQMPFVPPILGLDKFARITVSGQASQRVALDAGV